jgi:catechol 2,3-dioxygenase-like lactoylglutathione lyase family enzyme
MSFTIDAFQEAVVIVSDFSALTNLFCNHGGWVILHKGAVDPALLQAWQLDARTLAEECVLANPGIDSGHLRLIRFEGINQERMRSNDQSWDSGGIFDFNVRIASMDALYPQLQTLGWNGVSDPVAFQLGDSQVKEWLGISADRIRFAFIERVSPPLQGWEHMRPISQIFNSTQIVSDLDKASDFFSRILGFKTVIRAGNLNTEPGANVLGLPLNRAHSEKYELVILQPNGEMRGSVELLQYLDLCGRDFSQNNQPPNLGMLGLRFPVRHIDALQQHLIANHVTICMPLCDATIAPYGKCRLLAAKTPDGAWMEFIEY